MKEYVDGFVLPVPKKKLEAYRKLAQKAGKVWKKYGALHYFECVGDDLNPDTHGMKIVTFPKMVKPKPGEAIIFSFIVFKSRKHRDQVNAKVMKDPFMKEPENQPNAMPFDLKRMAYGGFSTIVKE